MSWVKETSLTWYQKFAINVIRCGQIPKHVAIIMDGNRRYATKNNVQKSTGHSRGFDKLAETLFWCKEIGISEVTVYAFSIENFKRNSKEVETLMDLARQKFQRLIEEKDKLNVKGVCIRVIGNLSLIPADLRKEIAKAVLLTKDNNKAFLNIAFAYTSRDEITKSIETIVEGVKNNDIKSDDVDSNLITSCMYSHKSPKTDIIIRTSGEVRFSDFMIWQIWNANVIFTDVLWPDFTLWHLLGAVFHYQRNHTDISEVENKLEYDHWEPSDRIVTFLRKLDEDSLKQLRVYAKS